MPRFSSLFFVSLAIFLCCFLWPWAGAYASLPAGAYGAVIVKERILDRRDRPIVGARVRVEVEIDGVAADRDGQTHGVSECSIHVVRSDTEGWLLLHLAPPAVTADPAHWFRGMVRWNLHLIADPGRELTPLTPLPLRGQEEVPTAPDALLFAPPSILRVFEEPEARIDGFPVWGDSRGRMDKIVVALQGFDLYRTTSATDMMVLVAPAGDLLRSQGIAIMMVRFPDAHLPPDQIAPVAARAVLAAARASGRGVALAGFSEGGIVGRWALTAAEQSGRPLPVHTLITLDSPNRGANLNPLLQAMTLRYGKRDDRDAVRCPAAQVLLTCAPTHVVWKRLGTPPGARSVAVACDKDTAAFDAFFTRLHHLNDRNGYPKHCRLIGVSSGSRYGESGCRDLLHVWLPGNIFWTMPASKADTLPGSLLPPFYVARFTQTAPLGLGGAYLRSAPVFVPTESALDAAPEETPPFDLWYARPEGSAPIAHDQVDPDEAAFVVRALVQSPW